MTNFIDREEIVAALASGRPLVILEALDAPYYEQGHIPGAILAPPASVSEIARARLANERDADIVVYCASVTCQNSEIVARKLLELGYANVRVYAGGKADWQDAGLALEHGSEARAQKVAS